MGTLSFSTPVRLARAPLFSAVVLLGACGGGGGGSSSSQPLTTPNTTFSLERATYSAADSIQLKSLVPNAQAVFLQTPDGFKIKLPLSLDGSFVMPVPSPELIGQTVTIIVETARGSFESGNFTFQPLQSGGSTAGISTLVYLGISIANLQQSIDEMIALSGDITNPEAMTLQSILSNVINMRDAIEQAMSGSTISLINNGSASPIVIDKKVLETLDQYYLAFLAESKNKQSINTKLSLASARRQADERQNPQFSIPALDCSKLIPTNGSAPKPGDVSWCQNMRTQIANDLVINYVGMGATAAGVVSGSILALTTIGVATTLAFPAAVIGATALGLTVMANAAGAGIQAASAYGTGSAQGTNIRDNINNLKDTAKGLVAGQLSRLIPNGGSGLIKELNSALTSLAVEKLFSDADKTITSNTKPVVSCSVQATSGGKGSFANRYDFGAAAPLLLSYQAFNIPDEFSVSDASGVLGNSGGLVSGAGSISVTSTSRYVTVKVRAPEDQTAWNYTLACR